MKQSLELLLVGLEEAFGQLPIPEAGCLTGNAQGPERSAIEEKFSGRHWQEIGPAEIAGEPDVLAYLTPVGFRFLLPSVLRATLVDPQQADVLCDQVLWSLAAPGEDDLWSRRGDQLVAAGERLGFSAKLVQALRPHQDDSAESLRKQRLEALTVEQLTWLLEYTAFLRQHRAAEFVFDELNRVEQRLAQELAARRPLSN